MKVTIRCQVCQQYVRHELQGIWTGKSINLAFELTCNGPSGHDTIIQPELPLDVRT